MTGSSRVLVAGAGIAGLATAKVLHDLGWAVDVVERRRDFLGTPTGLFLPGNGMRAFAALGAAAARRSCGSEITRLRLRAAGSSDEGEADLALVWPGAGPSLAIGRAAAQQALLEWCPVAVRPDISVDGLKLASDRVEVTLSAGTMEEYDLVVEADGAHSTVRRLAWPDVSARYAGECWWRGVVACPADLREWDACLCQEGTFLAMPIGGGLAYWVAGGYSAQQAGDSLAGRAARVRERFGDAGGVHSQVLDQVHDDSLVQYSPADEVWVEHPVRGRVVLLGDAAHATTPSMAQGAAMAAEDALVLGRELAVAPRVDEGLERYACRRAPRTRYVQETTGMRNRLAAMPLSDRLGVIAQWANLSEQSFAALVPEP